MPDRRNVLTPEALAMMDTIARTGSFAAAARELGKVPSALTYSVRQLEDALDVLLFDRRTRTAQLTAAGQELLQEGRRLLLEMDAVANRVRRVATGWETQLTLAVDAIIAPSAIFDLIDAFYALRLDQGEAPPTRLKLRSEVLSGTWESLSSGESDLVIGGLPGAGVQTSHFSWETLGTVHMVFAVAPHHPLAQAPEPLTPEALSGHRVVAIADSTQRGMPLSYGILPGQDVLTVPTLAAKLEAQLRGLGCGSLPEPLARRHLEAGRLVVKQTQLPRPAVEVHYAWRNGPQLGLALRWWIDQLRHEKTRHALLEQHAGLVL